MSTAEDILLRAVTNVHGADASPREEQSRLMSMVEQSMSRRGRMTGEAPTGLGKSFALLAPAFAAAVERGERTIIATQSLALQDQILDKDAPAIAQACEEITGVRPTFALQKGFSNYGCIMAARSHAREKGIPNTTNAEMANIARAQYPHISWVLADGEDEFAEKSRFVGDVDPREWNHLTVSSQDCMRNAPGGCPFVDVCHVRRATQNAIDADIIITNHAMLGVQAMGVAPVVMGRKFEKRPFHHLMIDECHGLPEAVRNQTSVKFTGDTPARAFAGVDRLLSASGRLLGLHIAEGCQFFSDAVKKEASAAAKGFDGGREGFVHMKGDTIPFDSAEALFEWLDNTYVPAVRAEARQADEHSMIVATKAVNRAVQLRDRVWSVTYDDEVARWSELNPDGSELQWGCSAVDVSAHCVNNLWRYNGADGEEHRLSVTCLSATVPATLPKELGLGNTVEKFQSPFTEAHTESMAYLPVVAHNSDEMHSLMNRWNKFDVAAHRDWAAPRIVEMVKANAGHTLVLCATRTSSEAYAKLIRAAGFTTFVQSELGTRNSIAKWKADSGSVLVGVKSLMTGVDAPGVGCSLVILDRPPRSPMNPLDEQRKRVLGDVYITDTVLLVSQAVGRLIRSGSDRGMVAVLDPRIADKTSPKIRYRSRAARKAYTGAIEHFGRTTHDMSEALEFLREQSQRRSA